jgi:hypothetical protein
VKVKAHQIQFQKHQVLAPIQREQAQALPIQRVLLLQQELGHQMKRVLDFVRKGHLKRVLDLTQRDR